MTLEPPHANMTHIAYSKNPELLKVRRDAVRLVKYRGWFTRKVARYFGCTPQRAGEVVRKRLD